MIKVTATSEKSPQVIHTQQVDNGSYWWQIRLVGWISQDTSAGTTTLYTKWQIGSHNYWPYWLDSHLYTVSLGGTTVEDSFSLPQDRSNAYVDKSSAKSIKVTHTNGSYSGTISINGYKCWEAFNFSDTITFPDITTVTPTPTPTPSTQKSRVSIINDLDPKFYIFADDQVLYSMNDEERYLLNPKLVLEINQVDSLDFTILPNNYLYSKLLRLKTTIEVRQGSEILFRGRVLDDETDFYNRMTVHCEGALAFLGDTILEPYDEETYSTAKGFFEDAMEQHVDQVPSSTPKRKLTPIECNVSADIKISNESYSYTSDMISTLANDVGGYFKLEYYDDGSTGISYLSSYNHASSQVIDFGENLIDLSKSVDASGIVTAVICQGAANEETGERPMVEYENSEGIATYGRITRYYTYDDIENDNNGELTQMAMYQLLLGSRLSMTVEVKAVDLHLVYPEYEKIRIGDSVRIRSIPHEIDSYFQCSRIEIDLQNPENTVYTFGATISALTDSTSKK